eukprot:Pgem_evm1s18802
MILINTAYSNAVMTKANSKPTLQSKIKTTDDTELLKSDSIFFDCTSDSENDEEEFFDTITILNKQEQEQEQEQPKQNPRRKKENNF